VTESTNRLRVRRSMVAAAQQTNQSRGMAAGKDRKVFVTMATTLENNVPRRRSVVSEDDHPILLPTIISPPNTDISSCYAERYPPSCGICHEITYVYTNYHDRKHHHCRNLCPVCSLCIEPDYHYGDALTTNSTFPVHCVRRRHLKRRHVLLYNEFAVRQVCQKLKPGWLPYFMFIVLVATVLPIPAVTAQGDLGDRSGTASLCCSSSVACAAGVPGLVAPVGLCHIKFWLSHQIVFGDGPLDQTGCVLRDSDGVLTAGTSTPATTTTTVIGGAPASIVSMVTQMSPAEVQGQCNGQTWQLGGTTFGTSICCTVNWSLMFGSQPVNITESVTLPVNVTAFLGQQQNPAKVCNGTHPNGTTYNYTCRDAKLLEVLPPDVAFGPTYLGRPQSYSWTNFSGARYPNFAPQTATPEPTTSALANDYTPNLYESLASLFVALRRRLSHVTGFDEYLARHNNKRQHTAGAMAVNN